ncbi:MAG TPA: hypothetical protein VFM53_03080 [Anaeromyxobacteraceae bacterium]|nr:hypothetical protein [Anaeromyxobacteraceae bacterium]
MSAGDGPDRPGAAGGAVRRQLRGLRIGALVVLLLLVGAWAVERSLRRSGRTAWTRPVEVGLVLLSPAGDADEDAWRRGAAALQSRLASEMARWRGPGMEPFLLTVVGPVRWGGTLPLLPEGDGILDRAAHAVRVWRTLREVDRAAGGGTRGFDVQVLVLCVPTASGPEASAEGSAALRGEVALVRATCTGDLSLPLQAVGHEILHAVGATDKYDAAGHARTPEGLAEPGRSPPYPQDHAEWMVGEVPVAPGRGRLPASLEEMRVGPATAREIGWAR